MTGHILRVYMYEFASKAVNVIKSR